MTFFKNERDDLLFVTEEFTLFPQPDLRTDSYKGSVEDKYSVFMFCFIVIVFFYVGQIHSAGHFEPSKEEQNCKFSTYSKIQYIFKNKVFCFGQNGEELEPLTVFIAISAPVREIFPLSPMYWELQIQ